MDLGEKGAQERDTGGRVRRENCSQSDIYIYIYV